MPTVGTPGYIGQVQKMDKTTAADGTLFDAIHQQLLNNDAFLNSEIIGMLQKAVNSGVTDFSSIIAGLTSNLNAFKFEKGAALVNGILNTLTNYGGMTDSSNLVQLDAPPAANVTPSLPGSARDDLAFLEMWLDATTGSPKYRIRYVDGVDFATYPEGINHTALVKVQGGQVLPTTYTFTKSTTDNGLYVAGTGSNADQTGLATLDGYVYAIPLFRIRRRNNAGFDPDNNPLGARDYFTIAPKVNYTSPIAAGTPFTIEVTNGFQAQVGDFFIVNSIIFQVTAKGTGDIVTVVCNTSINTNPSWPSANSFPLRSDRPDGLYSNIIDASDIQGGDLRHQVSLTGFNCQALLEKNLDLLLHGQLTTKESTRYGRDYIGLNVAAGMPDDANTLLRCLFNRSIDGTANGTPVTGTMNTGSASFANGVQGQALAASTTQYVTYPSSIPAGTNTYSIELMFKPNWNWNDGAVHGLLGFRNSSSAVFALYKYSDNQLKIVPVSGGVAQAYANVPIPLDLANSIIAGTWNKLLINVNAGIVSVTLNGVVLAPTYQGASSISPLSLSVDSIRVGNDGYVASGTYANASLDDVRVSNVVRTEQTLPNSFNGSNGDRILDGPNGDFNQWSDDQGGTAGVNGRTNPYGLSRVPNSLAGRISVNGQEIRHYYGNGLTAGFVTNNGPVNDPTGALGTSSEYIAVSPNETVDGVRTTFTFNKPSTVDGIFTANNRSHNLDWFDGGNVSITSATIDLTGKLTLVYATAPSSGASIHAIYQLAKRHTHFIPSIKGLVIHDWTDDTINTGTNPPTTYQTSKYNVGIINHVRVTPNGSSTSAFQNGGYTTTGLNARSTLTAAAASGATTLSIANGANFVSGQNIRISKGDGTWYTTTVTSVSGNTLTVPATTVDLAQNAVIEGTAIVTFTTAPAASSIVDIVYESVYTPALGDYIRIMYQYTPYQGLLGVSSNAADTYTILAESKAFVTSLGTGTVNTGLYSNAAAMAACTTNLPTIVQDYVLKNDAFTGVSRPNGTVKQTMQSGWDDLPQSNNYQFSPGRIGTTMKGNGGLNQQIRGVTVVSAVATMDTVSTLLSEQISSAVPTKAVYAALIKDQNGELKIFVIVKQQSTTNPSIDFGGSQISAADIFKMQGRPLIKNYGGVAA